jgi:hypothetical protein
MNNLAFYHQNENIGKKYIYIDFLLAKLQPKILLDPFSFISLLLVGVVFRIVPRFLLFQAE